MKLVLFEKMSRTSLEREYFIDELGLDVEGVYANDNVRVYHMDQHGVSVKHLFSLTQDTYLRGTEETPCYIRIENVTLYGEEDDILGARDSIESAYCEYKKRKARETFEKRAGKSEDKLPEPV